MTFLLYGANGYTGNLIARLAEDYGLTPILAGRSESKILPMAEELGYDYRIFDLNDKGQIESALKEVPVVLHAAGPFQQTAHPMMKGCLATGTHYLDITGEIPVFEMGYHFDRQAKEAGIMLMPGTGFDVVPTDCMALHLKDRLPDATELKLAFSALGGGVSHGTALTMAENLGESGAVRRDGKIIKVPIGHKTRWVPFPGKERFCMTIPWGDVSTAYHTTGIPNVETYVGIAPASYKYVKLQRYFNWLMRTSFVRNIVKRRIDNRPAGPSAEERAKSKSLVWGMVRNAAGEERQARFSGPEGYTLTAHTSLMITKRVLSGEAPIGFQTPAGAYGAGLIMELEGTERENLPVK